MAFAAADETSESRWRKFTAKQSEPTTVAQYCPERPYVELRVPAEVQVIRRIVFKISSHDQGNDHDTRFSGDAHNHGTYQGSYTWFEAAAITPSGHDRTPRRHLQSNVHADHDFREHVVCWEHDSPSLVIRDWLRSVRSGDSIQVIPKARHRAWHNFIEGAEIEIFVEDNHESSSRCLLPSSGHAAETSVGQAHSRSIYRPLDESIQEIRLIKVQPGLQSDDLICAVESTSLIDPQRIPYEGLSYCWGDPKDTTTLKVSYPTNEEDQMQPCVVSVSSNLFEALKHIRPECGQARVLWIDAVSINQSDIHERSQQVAMMGQIYANATGVVVWLGKSNAQVQKSIEDARQVTKRHREAVASGGSQPTTSELHHRLFESGFYHLDSPFFEYDWFRRTWVLQEVFNARAVSVYCGHDVLQWSLVLRLNQCLNRSMLVPNPVRKNVMTSLLAGLFDLKEDSESDSGFTYVTRHVRFGILDVLIRGLDLDAADPRDKLFALLGFGSETADVSQLQSDIRPNYTKSTGQVFADFTRWWISTHRSLRILSAVHLSVGRTWQELYPRAPLVDSERASWSLWHDGKAIWALGTLGFSPHTPYCAAGSTEPDISLLDLSPSPLVLRLRGRLVTRIATLARYPYYGDNRGHVSLHFAYHQLFDPVDTRGTWKSGIQQTELLELQRGEDQEELLGKVVDHYSAHLDFSSRTAAIECHRDAFFTTPEGDIGLCPTQARIGDRVVVLDGGNVPYLLRPRELEEVARENGPQYEFVGECYLEGYMDGRAVQETDEHDALPTQVFELV